MTVQVNIMILTKILGRLTNQALLVAICLFSPLIHAYEVNMSDSGVKASATALFSGLEESLRTLKGNNQLTLENVKTMLNNQLIPASNTKYFAFKVLGKNLAKLNEEQKIGVILSLQDISRDQWSNFNSRDHWVSVTHLELMQRVIDKSGPYIVNASKKYQVFLIDFFQNIKNLSESNINQEELGFYISNQKKINEVFEYRNKVKAHIVNEVEEACSQIEHFKIDVPVKSNNNRKSNCCFCRCNYYNK